jgi:hypothetical protein
VEGQPEQTALVEIRHQRHDLVADVQEWLALQLAAFIDDADAAKLLEDELARVTRWLNHRQRGIKPRHIRLELDPDLGRTRSGKDKKARSQSEQGVIDVPSHH